MRQRGAQIETPPFRMLAVAAPSHVVAARSVCSQRRFPRHRCGAQKKTS